MKNIVNDLTYEEHVIKSDDGFGINLIVEGIHCGSCIWLIENTLKQQPGIVSARINLSTKRLRINWTGEEDRIKEYVHIIEQLGYRLIPFTQDNIELEAAEKEQGLLKGVFISGVASMSIMMITVGIWMGNLNDEITPHLRTILHILTALIAVPATLYAGVPFYKSALTALKAKRTNMDVPISIGVLSALIISITETMLGNPYTYFDASVTLIFFLLIGRYLDLKMRNRARGFVKNLILSQPTAVSLVTKDGLKLISLSKAKVGDVVFVAPGDKIPADGVITSGSSEVDLSIITGETIPEYKKEGDLVIAGSLNLSNALEIKITQVGDNSTLAEIIKLIEKAEQSKALYVRIADRIASYYTPAVLVLALITVCGWTFVGAEFSQAMLFAVSVLIITCPCALGLAVPTAQIVASGKLLKSGTLIKISDAYEKLAQIDTVIFDKTGTLTLGKPLFVNADKINAKQMQIIASMALKSKHPLCQAIVENYEGDLQYDMKVEEVKGYGLKSGKYLLGNKDFCEVAGGIKDQYSEIWFRDGGSDAIRLEFEDALRSDAKTVINTLRKMGLKVVLLSGDRIAAVHKVALHLGLKQYFGEMKPAEKYEYILKLSQNRKKVLMVGDGLNDGPAIKLSFVSMSPSSGLEIVQNYADIVFQGNKLQPIVDTLQTAKQTQKIIFQNFAISFVYNAVTIPLAMLGWASPIMAAAVMSLSSIMVVVNSLRLK